jgi:uncharacterized protein
MVLDKLEAHPWWLPIRIALANSPKMGEIDFWPGATLAASIMPGLRSFGWATSLCVLRDDAMNLKVIGTLLIGLMLSVGPGIVRAGPYEDGNSAYERNDYATALRLWRPLAEKGSASAQYNLGVIYGKGQGVAQDYHEAIKWFRQSAEQGTANAQYNLGSMYAQGQGVAQDYGEAIKWYRLAAAQGNATAQNALGIMYVLGRGVPQDDKEAIKWVRLAVARGNATAQNTLGGMYQSGRGVPQDNKEAIKWYRLAAAQGDAVAQTNLGVMYQDGQGVGQDYGEAIKWYQLAAAQGNDKAQNNLRLVAVQGNAIAQAALGLIYLKGQGVQQDYQEALKWCRLAAAQGDAVAQTVLGAMYQEGQGVGQDYSEAIKWYRLASAQGNGEAQYNLGLMYAGGHGAPQDYVRSHMWLSISKTKGVSDEAMILQTIVVKMTSAQIELALKLAMECEESNYKQCDKTYVSTTSVPMQKDGGVYVVPVLINGAITLDFVVDSGAADVSIPADVVSTLMRTGTLKDSDFFGRQTYVLADGSKVPSRTFRIRSLKLGDKVLEGVNGSVAPGQGLLLLGQSFFSRFKSISIDNTKHELILEDSGVK